MPVPPAPTPSAHPVTLGTPRTHLHGGEAEGDDELRSGADEGRGRDRALPLLKDAVDAVGLGEQGRVAEGGSQAEEEPAGSADSRPGLGHHEEGDRVDEEDAGEQDVTELAAGGPDDGRVVVPHEGGHNCGGGHDTQHGQEEGRGRPGRGPGQADHWRGAAARVVARGPHVPGAGLASELVHLEAVPVAGLTVPTAGDALHHLFPLPRPTGEAALRLGHLSGVSRPLQGFHLGHREHRDLRLPPPGR